MFCLLRLLGFNFTSFSFSFYHLSTKFLIQAVGGGGCCVGELSGHLKGVLLLDAALDHQLGHPVRHHFPPDSVPGRNLQKVVRVVAVSGQVENAAGPDNRVQEGANPLWILVKPKGRTYFHAVVLHGKRRKLPPVGRLVVGVKDERQVGVVPVGVEQGLQAVGKVYGDGNVDLSDAGQVAPVVAVAVGAFLAALPVLAPLVVPLQARVKLHHEAVLDRHPRHLHQHVVLENLVVPLVCPP
mmetsp:Transcript_32361/g.69764  ORF Transcript_32361/g.69764 Transcript_32361/m.69764 type:complete len:240 (-) Transcript_32361:438-1157(-)